MSSIFNQNKLTNEEILNNQIDHINPIINRYKNFIIRLGIGWNYNYHMIKLTTEKFKNLQKLYLVTVIIPILEFDNILKNLENLTILWLDEFVLGIDENSDVIKLNFPKYLKNLNWANCKQLEYDNTLDLHPLALHDHLSSVDFDDLRVMEIPVNSINNLILLTSYNKEMQYIQTVNNLIERNTRLIQLNMVIQGLNNNSLKLISQHPNLTKLTFYGEYDDVQLQIINFIPLPNLKTLEFDVVTQSMLSFVNNLVKSSNNLERLRFPWLPDAEEDLLGLLSNLNQLKSLILLNCSDSLNAITFSLSHKSINYLEFDGFHPLKFDFSLFDNLAKLKRVKLTIDSNFHRYLDEIRDYYNNLNGWRAFFHRHIIQCWKV